MGQFIPMTCLVEIIVQWLKRIHIRSYMTENMCRNLCWVLMKAAARAGAGLWAESQSAAPILVCRVINRQALWLSAWLSFHVSPALRSHLPLNPHIPLKFILVLPDLYFMKQLYAEQVEWWEFVVAGQLSSPWPVFSSWGSKDLVEVKWLIQGCTGAQRQSQGSAQGLTLYQATQ